jgi:two-component system chemotaxis sensor kinase CheA
MDLSKYRSLFVSETQENLDTLGRLLVELEKAPADRDSIDTIFRLFHSIKGMSGTMGYQPLFELAHQLEELMDRVRQGRHVLDPTTVDVLLAGVDRMVQWISDVDAERPLVVNHGVAQLRERVEQLVGGTSRPRALSTAQPQSLGAQNPLAIPSDRPRPAPTPPPPSPTAGSHLLKIQVKVSPTAPDPGVRGFLLLRKLEALGTVEASTPSTDTLRAGQLDGPLQLSLRTVHPADKIEAFIRLMPDWHAVHIGPESGLDDAVGDPSLLEALEGLDFDFMEEASLDLMGPVPGLQLAPPAPSLPPAPLDPASLPPLTGPLPSIADHPEASTMSGVVRGSAAARTIRVKTRWLDDLLDRVGDLLIVSQRLWSLNQRAPRPEMSDGLGELSRLLNLLHNESLSARVTSFSVLTDRLPRVVRDLARQAGKRATLVVRGDGEQVDRAIIEGLDAPLTHLLRNAVEHGLESPADRATANKPATGVITLACVRVRDEIVVELGDDGRGIDRTRIVDRVVEQGLLDRETAERYAEHDLRHLLCMPGFTTRRKVGALAGRGVGMDAVNAHITALGGALEIHSEPGVGTLMRLRVPRTPGISKLLLVEAAGQVFGLPLGRVVRSATFQTAEVATDDEGHPTVIYQDEPHRLLHLAALLGTTAHTPPVSFPGVIFRGPRGPLILAVNQLVGQRDAVVKPLGALLERIDGLQGVTLDAVGQPVFVLDLDRAAANWHQPNEHRG